MGRLTVGDLACGRAGDKGTVLDLTLVASERGAYELLARALPAEAVGAIFETNDVRRYEIPELFALKYVLPTTLDAGPTASRRAGVHWQKAAISPLLALELDTDDANEPFYTSPLISGD
jgi:hypothetical protein